MRLWSIHPKYLDQKGIIAVWREGLLAKKVLKGKTRGYRNHPQLERFKGQRKPVVHIDSYLLGILDESIRRSYGFDKNKLGKKYTNEKIPVTKGQLLHEFRHLKSKLKSRDPEKYRQLLKVKEPEPHPIFSVTEGSVEKWEKI